MKSRSGKSTNLPLHYVDDDKHSKRRARLRCDWKRASKWTIPVPFLLLLLFFYTTETHIEVAFYKRGWIKSAIEELHPLAPPSVCPASPASYNTTLASSPKLLTLSPGIALRQGEDCFNFAAALPDKPLPGQTLPDEVIYHMYWRADLRRLEERQIYTLSSILNTQTDPNAKFILWTNSVVQLTSHSMLQPIMTDPRFSVRKVHLQDLSAGTPLQDSHILSLATDQKAWLDGDLIRVLLLYRHGGIWLDMDFLVLRDFRPLLEQEWLIQWDCYDKPYTPLNGAVMHFYRASPYLCEMMYAMTVEPLPRKASTDWGSLLYHKVWRRLTANRRKPFAILPWCIMDPRNCKLNNRLADPFEKDRKMHATQAKALESKLNSAFAIHLHNQWDKAFPKEGYIRRLVLPRVVSSHLYATE